MGKRRVPEGYTTVAGAATALGVTNSRVRQLIGDGTLSAYRAPGIKRAYLLKVKDVLALMKPRPAE